RMKWTASSTKTPTEKACVLSLILSGRRHFKSALNLLAPRGCLINYGELSGAVPPIDLYQLFPGSVFVTQYNGTRWVEGPHEFARLIEHALEAATKRPAVMSDIAGRFPLEQAA